MTIPATAATGTVLVQARTRTLVATHLLRVARDVGSPRQILELVEQAATTAARIVPASRSTSVRPLDAQP